MVMTIEPNGLGGLRVRQRLLRPVVYLDHWAVRLFSEEMPLQDRFIEALHSAGGTWLFSVANLSEFAEMTDMEQAQAAERLFMRALPAVHVADTTLDPGYLLEEGAPPHPDAPEQHWLLKDIADRAMIAGGVFNSHRFIQDAITHRDQLQPLFENMKESISAAVMSACSDQDRRVRAKKFISTSKMTLRDALGHELIRDHFLDPNQTFDEHDAVDFIHALPAALVCDYILLDQGWCHKLNSATRRLRKGGVTGRIAKCFSKQMVPDFLTALESTRRS